MQDQINELYNRIAKIEDVLAVASMPLELKEIIRNEIVAGEDSSVTLTDNYPVVLGEVTAPIAYTGTILLKNRGNEYVVGYLSKR